MTVCVRPLARPRRHTSRRKKAVCLPRVWLPCRLVLTWIFLHCVFSPHDIRAFASMEILCVVCKWLGGAVASLPCALAEEGWVWWMALSRAAWRCRTSIVIPLLECYLHMKSYEGSWKGWKLNLLGHSTLSLVYLPTHHLPRKRFSLLISYIKGGRSS